MNYKLRDHYTHPNGDILAVCDNDDCRILMLGESVLGGSFYNRAVRLAPSSSSTSLSPSSSPTLSPSSPIMDPNALSHVPCCGYQIMAFVLARRFASGHGLVLGLGAGSGVIAALEQFPEMQITVVEYDPQVIRLAFAYFPYLQTYVDDQRLSVVDDDALAYMKNIKKQDRQFDYIFCDISDVDGQGMFHVCNILPMLARQNIPFWINVLEDSLSTVREQLQDFSDLSLLSYQSFEQQAGSAAVESSVNVLVTSLSNIQDPSDQWVPYSDLSGPYIERIHAAWHTMRVEALRCL